MRAKTPTMIISGGSKPFTADAGTGALGGCTPTGGNKVVVFPDQQVVVVVTTANYHVPGAAALCDKILVDYVLQAEPSKTLSGPTTSEVFPIGCTARSRAAKQSPTWF